MLLGSLRSLAPLLRMLMRLDQYFKNLLSCSAWICSNGSLLFHFSNNSSNFITVSLFALWLSMAFLISLQFFSLSFHLNFSSKQSLTVFIFTLLLWLVRRSHLFDCVPAPVSKHFCYPLSLYERVKSCCKCCKAEVIYC